MFLKPKFRTTIRGLFGSRGDTWLTHLPELLDEFGQKWHLTFLPPFQDLSINFVTPALQRGGVPVVLKLGVPSVELTSEIEALKVYAGKGAVRLLAAEPETGSLIVGKVTTRHNAFDPGR